MREWFRHRAKIIFSVAAVLLCGVLAIVGGRLTLGARTGVQERTMPDGSVLVLQAATFGSHHTASFTDPSVSSLRFFGIGLGERSLSIDTWRDEVVLWFRRYDPTTRRPLDFSWWSHSVAVDQNGSQIEDGDAGQLAYSFSGNSSESGPRPLAAPTPRNYTLIVAHSSLPSIRLPGPTFKLRIVDTSGKTVAEFDVPHPHPGIAASWNPEPLPITRSQGEIAVTLKRVEAFRSNDNSPADRPNSRLQVEADFQITRNGKPTDWWESDQFLVFDALGNVAKPWRCDLSTGENAWKLQTELFRRDHAEFNADESWTIKNLPLLKSGEKRDVKLTKTLQGVTLEIVAIGGPGDVDYVTHDPRFVGPSGYRTGGVFNENHVEYKIQAEQRAGSQTTTVSAPVPHLALKVSGMTDKHRLGLRGPGLGAHHLHHEPEIGDYLFFEAPAGTDQVDLTIIVQQGRTFEFLVKPPQAKNSSAIDSSEGDLERPSKSQHPKPIQQAVGGRGISLVGTWKAIPAPSVTIETTFDPDGHFIWRIRGGGQAQVFKGRYVQQGDRLVLTREDGKKMNGVIGDKGIRFRAQDKDPTGPELEFTR